MFGLGIPELMIILVLALVVFGPKKLPELGKSAGRAIAEFKKAQQEFQESMKKEMQTAELPVSAKEIASTNVDAARREQVIPKGVAGGESVEPEHPHGSA